MTTLITVFADASRSDTTSGCGWWFRSDKIRGTGSRQMETGTLQIHELELWGIRNGILEACLRHPVPDITLVVQCDNVVALQALLSLHSGKRGPLTVSWTRGCSQRRVTKRKTLSEFEQTMLAEIKMCGAKAIYLKHVKGHTGNKDARSHVNKLTDGLANQARLKP
jgi:hypothetical protein